MNRKRGNDMEFPQVFGETSEVCVEKSGLDGLTFYLNGAEVPGVISQKLILGDGVPKVALEIAVRKYTGTTVVEIE